MQTVDLKINSHHWQAHWRDEADQSVFNEIFKFDEYRAAKEAIKNAKDPIVDVGAHAGFFTMYCRALNDRVKIFAIEPEAGNLRLLKQHLKENHISGVKVVAGALAEGSGERKLFLSGDSHNHFVIPTEMEGSISSGVMDSSTPRGSARNDNRTLKIKALSFSDFCRQNKIKKISLLKIDIEGGEYEVFAGMSAPDLAMVNFVILEYHKGGMREEIENKLRVAGFGVQIFPSHFDKTMGFIFANNKRTF